MSFLKKSASFSLKKNREGSESPKSLSAKVDKPPRVKSNSEGLEQDGRKRKPSLG